MNKENENEATESKVKQVESVDTPAILEINVHDKVAGKAVGPGQR